MYIYTYKKRVSAVSTPTSSCASSLLFYFFLQAASEQGMLLQVSCGKHSSGTVFPTTEFYKTLDLYLNPIFAAKTFSLFWYRRVCL